MKNKNLIINCSVAFISFGLGSLAMFKLIKLSSANYAEKHYKGYMDKYKDNEIVMGYYERWKKNRA